MRASRWAACGVVAVVLAATGWAAPKAGAVVLPPANDDFASAAPVTFGANMVVNLTAATTEAGEPNTAQFAGGSAWWKFSTASSQRVHFIEQCAWFDVYRIDGPGFAGLTDVVPDPVDAATFRADTITSTAGASYAIQCGGYTGVNNAQMQVDIAVPAANDDYANAAALTLGVATPSVDIMGATQEPGEPGLFGPLEKSLWWTWTASSDGLVLQQGFPTNIYRVDGAGFAGLTPVTVSQGVPWSVSAGTTYAFQARVYNYWPDYSQVVTNNAQVSLDLEPVVPPPNDDLANAALLTPGTTVSADMTGATLEPGEPVPTSDLGGGYPITKTAWWTFTVAAPENVTFHCPNCDALMGYLANGPGYAGLSPVPGLPSVAFSAFVDLTIQAVPGTTYAIQLGNLNYRGGVQSLSSTVILPPANDDLADAAALPTTPSYNDPAYAPIDAATIEPDEPNVGAASQTFGAYGLPETKSTWWTWTPDADADVTVYGQPVTFVYTSDGPGFAGLTQVPKPNPYGPTVLHAISGTTYYVQIVGSYNDSGGTAPLIEPNQPDPPNDDYANAAPLPFFHQSTTIAWLDSATVEPGEPNLTPPFGGTPYSKSLWWTWTAPSNERIAGDLSCPAVNVYRVDGPGFAGLTLLQQTGNVTIDATAGQQYAFQCLASYGQNTTASDQFDVLANRASTSSEGTAPGTITITSPDGTYVVDVGVAQLSSGALPAGVVDLSGALSYGITNVAHGSTVQVTIQLPAGSNPNAAYKLSNGAYVDDTSLATFNGDAVTLTLTDGGAGDSDGRADGNISDPVVLTRAPKVPGAPTQVSATPGDASAHVTFLAPASDGGKAISSYTATCTSSNSGTTRSASARTSPVDVISLTNNRTYTCQVTAQNVVGFGAPSAASASFVAGAPVAPTGASALSGSTTSSTGPITVTYNTPANNGAAISKYTVRCTSSNGGGTVTATRNNATAAATTVSGATTGKTYTCTVTATNSRGTSTASSPSVPVVVGSPSAPTAVTAKAGSGSATVTWTAPSSNNGSPITNYVITPFLNGVAEPPKPYNSMALTEVVTGLQKGKKYTFEVAAGNGRGVGVSSVMSNAVSPK